MWGLPTLPLRLDGAVAIIILSHIKKRYIFIALKYQNIIFLDNTFTIERMHDGTQGLRLALGGDGYGSH